VYARLDTRAFFKTKSRNCGEDKEGAAQHLVKSAEEPP